MNRLEPNAWYGVGALAALAIVMAWLWYLTDQQHKCEAKGGVYARVWTPHGDAYQCLTGDRKP